MILVFPTHVGVFLVCHVARLTNLSLPHTRGGVSHRHFIRVKFLWSSPHTWGCFSSRAFIVESLAVFPTHVGVFPVTPLLIHNLNCLPHTRGGVSDATFTDMNDPRSSPHTWGCFSVILFRYRHSSVFPTHVGVFPSRRRLIQQDRSLPHTRGGVSS